MPSENAGVVSADLKWAALTIQLLCMTGILALRSNHALSGFAKSGLCRIALLRGDTSTSTGSHGVVLITLVRLRLLSFCGALCFVFPLSSLPRGFG